MINFGEVPANSVLPIPFASYAGATGASVTLTGLLASDVEIYKGTSMTQRASDAGVVLLDTDGIDIDGVTGIHGFSIDLSDNTDASFYAVGSFYYVVVSAVTIDSQTVNFIAATFRIKAAEAITGKPKVDVDGWLGTAASTPTVAGVPNVNTKTWNDLTTVALPLIPTTAGRTLDVSAGGEAGLDWANVGSPTTTVGLTNTTVGIVTLVTTLTTYTGNTVQTGDSFARIGAAGASLSAIPWNASWDTEVQSEVQDAIEVNQLDHLIQVADPGSIVANSSLWAALTSKSATPAYSSYVNTTDSLEAQRDNVGTVGAALVLGSGALANVTAWTVAITGNVTGNLSGSVGSVIGAVGSVAGAVGSVTGNVGGSVASIATGGIAAASFAAGAITATVIATGAIDADALAADAVAEIWTTALTESYGTDGSALTGAQLLYLTYGGILEHAIVTTTKTVKKLDGSTTGATFTLDSATSPTSITRAS